MRVSQSRFRNLFSQPSDVITLCVLFIVCLTLAVRLPSASDLAGMLVFHCVLLLAVCALVIGMSRNPSAGWVPVARTLATVGTMFTLYSTLGHFVFDAIPWLGDSTLARIDLTLGIEKSPVLRVEPFVTARNLEFFSFFYAIFIPYLYLSIMVGCVGRPESERSFFITGFALTYAIGFVGYLLVPARGPVVFLAAEFASELQGGFFLTLIVESIETAGGPHGAFPSLHVGASTYLCLFDLRHNVLRGMTYLPIVVLISISTLVLRYHYLVDLIAGVFVAFAAYSLALHWTRNLQVDTTQIRGSE